MDLGALVMSLADSSGFELGRVGLGFARAAPAVTLVPAFGLKAVPAPVRLTFALFLALAISPAFPPLDVAVPWPSALLTEVLRGMPVAVAAAVPLYVASQLGGLVDGLRGSNAQVQLPVVEGATTPLGGLFGLLAGAIFLSSGGPSRVATALLVATPVDAALLVRVTHDLLSGISLAIAVGAPLLAASAVLEVALALIARAATPTNVQVLLAPIRGGALLVVTALLLDRLGAALGLLVQRGF